MGRNFVKYMYIYKINAEMLLMNFHHMCDLLWFTKSNELSQIVKYSGYCCGIYFAWIIGREIIRWWKCNKFQCIFYNNGNNHKFSGRWVAINVMPHPRVWIRLFEREIDEERSWFDLVILIHEGSYFW